MKLTFYGHSSFLIESKGKSIIVDPFISANPQASEIDINSINADYILLTHGHQDHILDVEAIASNGSPLLISNYEIVTHYSKKGIQGFGMNHGGSYRDDSIGSIKMVNAVHSSSFPDGSYAGNPAGFVIQNDEACVYIAGDTSAHMDMKLIPMMGYKLDLAILPIGDTFTMDYKEASLAAELVQCSRIVGCHYNTFPPIQIDEESASMYFTDKGQELVLLDVGQSYEV